MTLPVSPNTITMAQINTEIGTSGIISLNDANVRTLANKPSGIISMSDLHGKSWLTGPMVSQWVATNGRSRFWDSYAGSSPANANYYTANGPYQRDTPTGSATAIFSGSTAGLGDSTTTTIVMMMTGCQPTLSTYNINGGAYTAATATSIYSNWNENTIYLITVNTSWKNINSVALTWNRISANRGSWPFVACLPGKWGINSNTALNGAGTLVPSPAYSIALGVNYLGAYNAAIQPLYNFGASGVYVMLDMWWYNNGAGFMYVNPTASAHTPRATLPQLDAYGDPANPTNNASTTLTWVSA